MIVVRVVWAPLPEWRGAFRVRDREVWQTGRWCGRCRKLGYDPNDVDAVLEAQRLGVAHAPEVVPCDVCQAPTCNACCESTGTMCRDYHAEGPQ